jgi:hypothetical protein
MSQKKINIRSVVLILIILAATAMRLVSFKFPFLSNFTPVGAIALFGGAYFNPKWKAYIVVLLSLVVSDILINYLRTSNWQLLSAGSEWVYFCFIIMVFIGSLIKKVNVLNVFLASLAAVAIHWLILELPWFYGDAYPHTLAGYGLSLMAALPFEKNMILGDIVFGAILFGGFELAKSRYTVLRNQKELAV